MRSLSEVTVCIVEVAMPRWFGLPKTYHGYDVGICLGTELGSRKGGAGTPFLGLRRRVWDEGEAGAG